jgi:hypothetical protein
MPTGGVDICYPLLEEGLSLVRLHPKPFSWMVKAIHYADLAETRIPWFKNKDSE